ncbi:MAG: OmpA family protein [Chitinophagaceae bacterium]|nr:MAG: OmpA family protein [Chitinophagaceae bacterium]
MADKLGSFKSLFSIFRRYQTAHLYNQCNRRFPPTGQKILDEMALALNKVGNKSVRIIGHTDSQGNATTNLGLSLQRANAVREYLVNKGVNRSLLSTNGLGSTQPIAENNTEEGRRRNRRIEFEVI